MRCGLHFKKSEITGQQLSMEYFLSPLHYYLINAKKLFHSMVQSGFQQQRAVIAIYNASKSSFKWPQSKNMHARACINISKLCQIFNYILATQQYTYRKDNCHFTKDYRVTILKS
jgi:hypothetical protein